MTDQNAGQHDEPMCQNRWHQGVWTEDCCPECGQQVLPVDEMWAALQRVADRPK